MFGTLPEKSWRKLALLGDLEHEPGGFGPGAPTALRRSLAPERVKSKLQPANVARHRRNPLISLVGSFPCHKFQVFSLHYCSAGVPGVASHIPSTIFGANPSFHQSKPPIQGYQNTTRGKPSSVTTVHIFSVISPKTESEGSR